MLREFRDNIHADSSRASVRSKLRTIDTIFERWGFDPFPPSVLKIQCLGAALRAGGYLAAEAYLSAYKMACQRGNHAYSPVLLVAHSDAIRSCTRGLGGPTRARSIPFELLNQLTASRLQWGATLAAKYIDCGRMVVVAGSRARHAPGHTCGGSRHSWAAIGGLLTSSCIQM